MVSLTKIINLEFRIFMITPFQLLQTGNLQNIQHIPNYLNYSNVNEINNNLNIFEALCNLISQQQDLNVKNILENITVQVLEKMISITETNWDKKDANNNTIFEWGIWSNSSKIMEVLYGNKEITDKFIVVEKEQILNLFRVIEASHIYNDFREQQKIKLIKAGLTVSENDANELHKALAIVLQSYLDKYSIITADPENQNIIFLQNQIVQYIKVSENLIKFRVNPSTKANEIFNLLTIKSLDIQDIISKIPNLSHKSLAEASFKNLVGHIHKIAEVTLSKFDLSTSPIGNNVIAIYGNKIFSIKQNILKNSDPEVEKSLIKNLEKVKFLVEPIIEKIVKQPGFNPNIKDQLGSNTVSWLGEFGAEFLNKSIESMHTKPDMSIIDGGGRTPLDWYCDYNYPQVVEIFIKNGGNLNTQSRDKIKINFQYSDTNFTIEQEFKATPVHRLFLNNSKINADKPKLPTLKVLLNKENKPPFDPNIKMIGNKTVADILEDKKVAINDYPACKTLLEDYTIWYNDKQAVDSLGTQLENFDLYA